MKEITSYANLVEELKKHEKTFLLLYKEASNNSSCAYKNILASTNGLADFPLYSVNVSDVKDIHVQYEITSVPTLLVFESQQVVSMIKGCMDTTFYKALFENSVFQAKAKAEGKTYKNVTVYSTPTCSWCTTLKNWLRKNGVPFTDIDISKDEHSANELVRRSGQQGVPQTEINGQIVVGFDQVKLKQLLEI